MDENLENLPGGAYRLKVYEAIKSTIGRDLNKAEHVYLSNLLKEYARSTANVLPGETKKVEHLYTCVKCREQVVKEGAKPNKNFRKKHVKFIEKEPVSP